MKIELEFIPLKSADTDDIVQSIMEALDKIEGDYICPISREQITSKLIGTKINLN